MCEQAPLGIRFGETLSLLDGKQLSTLHMASCLANCSGDVDSYGQVQRLETCPKKSKQEPDSKGWAIESGVDRCFCLPVVLENSSFISLQNLIEGHAKGSRQQILYSKTCCKPKPPLDGAKPKETKQLRCKS